VASLEAFTDERGGHSVPAADFEHTVIRTDLQLLDHRSQSLAQSPKECALSLITGMS
jgi:hypothetical protein